MRIYACLCEGRWIYARGAGFMRMWIYARDAGFIPETLALCGFYGIYTRDAGFMRGTVGLCGFITRKLNLCEEHKVYMDLCEGRWIYARDTEFMRIYADLCEGRWIFTTDTGFMRIYAD